MGLKRKEEKGILPPGVAYVVGGNPAIYLTPNNTTYDYDYDNETWSPRRPNLDHMNGVFEWSNRLIASG
jgi:hypothetical protein